MPLETGPTLYLPYSHQYEPGYLAFHLPEFTEYFQANYTQLPLEKGDAAFFNPGAVPRRRHERLDHRPADGQPPPGVLALRPSHGDRRPRRDVPGPVPGVAREKAAGVPDSALDNVIAASAEGYAFPTNLDRDQPIDGIAPQTQADLVRQASPRSGARRPSSRPSTPKPHAGSPTTAERDAQHVHAIYVQQQLLGTRPLHPRSSGEISGLHPSRLGGNRASNVRSGKVHFLDPPLEQTPVT